MDLLSELAIKIYEPPLSLHRESGRIADTSDPLSVAMLVVDLDTELAMNGIVEFLGNSTGLYASQTVEALERIGCPEDAQVLREILRTAAAGGMTHDAIQDERRGIPEYSVVSFTQLHSSKWREVTAAVQVLSSKLDFSRIGRQAEAWIAQHEGLFRSLLGD